MIVSVVRAYHWQPKEIENLYLDDADFHGLEYWYNDVAAVDKSIIELNEKTD